MSLITQSKRLWSRVLLRGVHYSDRHRQLDVLYRVRDPWGLDCDRERLRFEATNAIIQREFGHLKTLLELGCGEGLQSEFLAACCDELYGIDVSAIAVGRARERCPNAVFDVGDVTESDQVGGCDHFDLVVGCEMLYYVKDVRRMIERMSALGDACLVTYYLSQRERLDAEIALRPGSRTDRIRHGDTEWIVAWWRNPASPGQATVI